MKIANLLFYFGLISIPLSIGAWLMAPDITGPAYASISDPALRNAFAQAHAERWGIFVGLWAPTLMILSQILKQNSKA